MLLNLNPFEPLVSQAAAMPAFVPATDVTVGEGDLVLTMDVPGVAEGDLSIELLGGYLVVRGERRLPELAGKANLAHRERAFGRFERRIRIPEGVDADAIMANLDHGVLSLIVPKPERMKPKTIAIGTGTGAGGDQRRLETTNA